MERENSLRHAQQSKLSLPLLTTCLISSTALKLAYLSEGSTALLFFNCCELDMLKGVLIALLGSVVNIIAQNEDVIDLSFYGSRIFGKPVKTYDESWYKGFGNAEEQGPYLEGDLLVPSSAKNGIAATSSRWKRGEVPFEIRGGYSELQQGKV